MCCLENLTLEQELELELLLEKMCVGAQTFTSTTIPALEMYARETKIPYDQLENANGKHILHILYTFH